MGSTPGALAGDALLARRAPRIPVLLALCIASVLNASSLASSTAAQSLDLRWRAPPECPRREAVQLRILNLLKASEPKGYALRVVAKVARSQPTDYRISLQIDTGTHRAERGLHGTTCVDLVEAAAWLIALTVDPELSPSERSDEGGGSDALGASEPARDGAGAARAGAGAASPARRDPGANSGSKAKPVGARDVAHEQRVDAGDAAAEASGAARAQNPPQDKAASPLIEPAEPALAPEVGKPLSPPWPRTFRVGANAGIVTGDGAGAQAALGAFVGYGVGALYTQLRIYGSLPREVDVTAPGQVRLWALAAELSECALFGAALRVGPCVGVSVLRSAAHLEGLAVPRDRAYVWAAGSAGIQLFWLLPQHVELSLAAGARLPVSKRPRYVVEGLGTVLSAQSWAADVRLGVGFALR